MTPATQKQKDYIINLTRKENFWTKGIPKNQTEEELIHHIETKYKLTFNTLTHDQAKQIIDQLRIGRDAPTKTTNQPRKTYKPKTYKPIELNKKHQQMLKDLTE
jgi:hypothetical protein